MTTALVDKALVGIDTVGIFHMDYWYIKGDKTASVYIYNPLTGTKRHVLAPEATVIRLVLKSTWDAKKTLPQAVVNGIPEII
jgi:hypothetical protein